VAHLVAAARAGPERSEEKIGQKTATEECMACTPLVRDLIVQVQPGPAVVSAAVLLQAEKAGMADSCSRLEVSVCSARAHMAAVRTLPEGEPAVVAEADARASAAQPLCLESPQRLESSVVWILARSGRALHQHWVAQLTQMGAQRVALRSLLAQA
jgi:hypothetical protein